MEGDAAIQDERAVNLISTQVLKRGSANVSDSLYGALDGPAVVLHSHFYWQGWMRKATRGLISQTRQACDALNRNPRLRVVANGRVEVLS